MFVVVCSASFYSAGQMELSEELTPSSPYTLDISSTIATKFTCAVIFSQGSKNTQLQKVQKIREFVFHKKIVTKANARDNALFASKIIFLTVL